MGKDIPELRMLNGQKVIYCDGQPFLLLGLQMDCDSCYDAETIAKLMRNAKKMGCTAVSLLLYWRLIEPKEGLYDFSILEHMLAGARDNDLKIVLVWFGTYKNTYMHYAPDWLQEDIQRFRRVVRADGVSIPYVACSNCIATRNKDAMAVEQVFTYLRDHDIQKNVVLFQVNNETGILGGTVRCHCPTCERKFHRGGYVQQYGSRADEVFATVSNLDFQEYIAKRAKDIYNLPCYMNAWLAQPWPDCTAGNGYPSGGPNYRVMDIYRQHKHYIDFVSPDIYTPGYRDFMRVASDYKFEDNPLYIAEHALGRSSRAYKNVYYAIGEFAAIGFDPWAIDCAYPDIMEMPLCDMAHERWSAEAYDILESFVPIRDAMIPVAMHMGTNNLKYWVQEEAEQETCLDFGDVFVKVRYCNPELGQSRGMAIRLDSDRFIVLGCKSIVTFLRRDGCKIELKDSQRGRFEGMTFISERKNTIAWHETAKEVVWIKECGVSMVILAL